MYRLQNLTNFLQILIYDYIYIWHACPLIFLWKLQFSSSYQHFHFFQSHVLASVVCLVALPLGQRLGSNIILAVSYLFMTVQFMMNLHPILFLMIPSTVIFGVALGLTVNAQIICLMTIAIKLSNVYRLVDEDEEIRNIRWVSTIYSIILVSDRRRILW